MPFDYAVFDWNGTLLNDLRITYAATVHVFEQISPGANIPTLKEYRQEFSAGDIMESYYRRGLPNDTRVRKVYDLWVNYYQEHCMEARLADKTVEMLSLLKEYGITMAIVSAAPKASIKQVEEQGIAHFFEWICFGVDEKEHVMHSLLARYKPRKILPRNTLYVDDQASGVVAARKIGVTAFAFTGGLHPAEILRKAGPNWIIPSLINVAHIANAQRFHY